MCKPACKAILSVLQIRRVFDDNSMIIMSVLHKNICCGYSLELPRQGNSNEYPQHMFLWRNKQTCPLIITKYPSYLFFCQWGQICGSLSEASLYCAHLSHTMSLKVCNQERLKPVYSTTEASNSLGLWDIAPI